MDLGINGLYYITHISNLASIMQSGVLSHAQIENSGVGATRIYDNQIVAARKERTTPDGKSLWEFANLYFNPRNPMLYRVLREKPVKQTEIIVICFSPVIMNNKDIYITTGNARSWQSEILSRDAGLKRMKEIQKNFQLEWWSNEDGSKIKIMAECLVPDRIPPELIQGIYVLNHKVAEYIKINYPDIKVDIIPEPHMFFQPVWRTALSSNLSLVDGDMFFSQMQTLTISVNCVGVMGKGLASRAKYQFPGMYVKYQDLCKEKKLSLGKPYVLKKEYSLDEELADSPENLRSVEETQFLLFPTKNHWRQKSDIVGIEDGLKELVKNYKRVGANCNNLCNRKTASTLITVLKERTANTYDTSS
ncbi:MAG: DUF4433 domain-containing protein, partial [Anaerolineales bacterium]|nr:DUF4433 domain-containing protein [Anaerolineales bacterium]